MPSSNQAIDLIKSHHVQISLLLDSLRLGSQSRQNLICELFVQLRIHSVLEQQLLYPAVACLVSKEVSINGEKGLYRILALMLSLEYEQKNANQFHFELGALSSQFAQHVHEQESVTFSQLLAQPQAVDFSELANRLEAKKADMCQSMRLVMKPINSDCRYQAEPQPKRTRCA